MAFYMDSKRIPPERLVDRPPQQYDRILQTYDIDGARSKVKKFQPESHGYSLKTNDITGAQPKKKIRNIWGQYSYNPTDKNLTKSQDFVNQQLQLSQAPVAGAQTGHGQQQYDGVPKNQSQVQINNESLPNSKLFQEKRHIQPGSQIQKESVLKPAEVLQPYLDYDKVVQPYDKPNRDKEIYNKYQEEQQNKQNQPKYPDLPDKMEQYRQTQGQMRQYDSQALNEMSQSQAYQPNQQQQGDQYQNNKEAFYRGYTPNQESQAKYPETKSMLENKVQQMQNQQQPQNNNEYQNNKDAFYRGYTPNQESQAKYPETKQMLDKKAHQLSSQAQLAQKNLLPPQQQQQPNYNDPNQQQQQQQGLNRQNYGSQSVANINQVQNQGSWNSHKYNLIGGYVEDKRQYHRDHSSSLEKKYYDQYSIEKANEMRKTANKGTQPVTSQAPQVKLDPRQLDHTDQQAIQALEQQINSSKDNHKFGRSQLFDDFQIKPNIASHQKQFIGNIIQQRQQTKFPQRYGPEAVRNLPNNILDE